MDVAYVNPFINSTIDTFKMMIMTEIQPGKAMLKSEPYPNYDVSGIIGLSGNAQGSIAISFPKITALKTVSKMLGMQIKVVGPELSDGIGEIANIIAGNAKQHLEKYKLSISLPNVVIGRQHVLASQKGIPTILVPFASELGQFGMEVALKTE
ncbi:MAG: chemotaxis protein CheX [Chitinivibrionales bacterium]|nr:chemotaxis protein CheX [Chitinivibrionales bacterium]